MAWSPLDMLKCGEAGLRRVKAVYGHTGWQSKAIIDEQGRLYTFGYNGGGACGFPDPANDPQPPPPYSPYDTMHEAIVGLAIPPGTENIYWKKVVCGEHHVMALDASGQLWLTGDFYSEVAGLDPAGPEGYYPEWYRFRKILEGYKWKDFYYQAYAVLAIGQDDRLWVWGYQPYAELGLGHWDGVFTPTLHPDIEDKVKFVYADLDATYAVTEKDEVWLIGGDYADFWAYGLDGVYIDPGDSYWNSPHPIKLRITDPPVGAKITSICGAAYVVAITYDNGDLYVGGYSTGYRTNFWKDPYLSPETWDFGAIHKVDFFAYWKREDLTGDDQLDFIELPVAPRIVEVCQAEEWGTFSCVDEHGNIWTGDCGNGRTSTQGNNDNLTRDGGYIHKDIPETGDDYSPMVLSLDSHAPGAKPWKWSGFVNFYGGGMAIDAQGYVYVWGSNWSGRLGLGVPYSLSPYYLDTPQLAAAGVKDYQFYASMEEYTEDQLTGLNYNPAGVSPFDQPPDQLEEHNLCGHWHLNVLGEEVESWGNCWYITLAVSNDGKIRMHFSGRWWPWQFGIYEYDISANTWKLLYMRDDHWGAAYHDGEFYWGHEMMIFFNGAGIGTGNSPFDYEVEAVGQGIWIWEESEEVDGVYPTETTPYFHLFTDIARVDGKHRMGVDSDGAIYIVGSLGSSLVVRKSIDKGRTWQDIQSIPIDATVLDWKLAVDPSKIGNYQVALLLDGGFKLYGDTDGGASPSYYGYKSAGESGAQRMEFICATKQGSTIERWFLTIAFVDKTIVFNGTYVGDYSWDKLIVHEGFTVNLESTVIEGTIVPVLFDDGYAHVWKFTNYSDKSSLGIPTSDFHFGVAGNEISTMAAAGFAITVPSNPEVAMVFSEDSGETWHIRATPLNHSDNWDDPEHDIMFAIKGVNWKQVEEWKYPYPKIPPLKIQYGPFPEEPN